MNKVLITVFLLISSQLVLAHSIKLKVTLSPAGSFEAENVKLRGNIKVEGEKYSAEELWLKVDDFKTGIDLRDEHFKKHLGLEKTPKITMKKIVAENAQGSGLLNVNGVDKTINFSLKKISDKKLQANFTVKNSEFKLPSANYMGVGVEDDVVVEAVIDL